METRRIILAIVLSLGVLVLWQYRLREKSPGDAGSTGGFRTSDGARFHGRNGRPA